jgi:hypothetical protein
MGINRLEAPAISVKGLISVLQLMMPQRLTRDSSMFDVGYEACKRDLAVVLGKTMDMDFSENPAGDMLRQLRRKDAV